MVTSDAIAELLKAYESEIVWLEQKAREFESKDNNVAEAFRHRAKNLRSFLQGYERLEKKSEAIRWRCS